MTRILSGARALSYPALADHAARAATGLEKLGVGPGDSVALLLRNDFPFFEASMAAGRLGAYSIALNWHSSADEVRYMLQDSGAKVIFAHADLVSNYPDAFDETPTIVVETPPEIQAAYKLAAAACTPPARHLEWNTWLSQSEPRLLKPVEAPGPVLYTSGTTGHPKGVRRNPPTPQEAAELKNIYRQCFLGVAPDEDIKPVSTIICGPMYHAAPNGFGMLAASLGAEITLQPRFDAEELLTLIERHRVTTLYLAPIMFHRLLDLPPEVRRRYDISSLRFVTHAAAPCPQDVKRKMIDWWGPIIHEFYGGTEANIITECSAEEWLQNPGTVGRAIKGAEVRILDANRNEVRCGEIGEIACRQHRISDFTYHNAAEKRAEVERDGLITLGDIGYLNEDGYLFICDRSKDMIISGGVNIYPAEIESVLQTMPGVIDCAVFGIPDREYGEAVHAVVQPHEGATLRPDEVRQFLRARIAGFKVPRTFEFSSTLPREDSGKIFKRKLREAYWGGRPRPI